MTFDLPDFETPHTIEPTAIDAMSVVYASCLLEELRMFDVVDRLVQQFFEGRLPIGQQAGAVLFAHWRAQADRLSSAERRQFYCRSLGIACGSTQEATPNREFNDLWARFVASVSSFVSQLRASTIQPSQTPVVAAGRDLAANLSLHGYGMGLYVARDLQRQLAEAVRILSDPEIVNAFGARDMWQVIDRVATLDLGGARQVARYRTQASSGIVIIRWLARRSALLTADAVNVLDASVVRTSPPNPALPRLSPTPTDLDLVAACEHWLAAVPLGTSENEGDG